MRYVVIALILVVMCATTAEAQSNCRSLILPSKNSTQTSGDLVETRLLVPPPRDTDIWGKITYPAIMRYVYPDAAVSVGLMTVRAETLTLPGYVLRRAGFFIDPSKTYVVGAAGVHEWIPDGIRFVWYHTLDTRVTAVPPQSWTTLAVGDRYGLHENLSVALQRNEGVIIGINVLYPYPEPVYVELALHIRECF